MVKEAEANKEADEKKKEEAEIKNAADHAIFTTEGALEELKDKISEDDKKDIESKIEELKKAIESDVIDDMKSKTEELNKAIMDISSKIYEEEAKKAQAEQPETEEAPKEDDVEEAKFEEK